MDAYFTMKTVKISTMRRILFQMVLLVCSYYAVGQNYYTVQVGMFLNAQPQDFDAVRSLGFIYANKMDGNLSRVYIGGYDTRQEADKVTDALRKRGYGNAQTQEVMLNQGSTVTVIQLVTRQSNQTIEWESLEKTGDLFVIVNNDKVKVVTGPYADVNAAKKALPDVQKLGYKDAFIKNVNSNLLFRVTEFETGQKKPLIPLTLDKKPPTTSNTQQGTANNNKAAKKTTDQQTPSEYGILIPKSYDESGGRIAVKSPEVSSYDYSGTNTNTAAKSTKSTLPNIRGNVRRRSAMDLQRVLRAENTYNGEIDGYYGPGTQNAYETAKTSNRDYQKYLLLADRLQVNGAPDDRLQQAIDNLPTDPSAPYVLDSSPAPIAKAYKAYLLFTSKGPGTEVNSLMNAAIKAAYNGQNFKQQPPFDYRATYAYQDLDQLILHIYYIHASPSVSYAAPCWLNESHPRESAKAIASVATFSSKDFQLQSCDYLQNWEEVRTLLAIASDMNSEKQLDPAKLSAASAHRNQLLTTSQPLTKEAAAKAENWHRDLWDNLTIWAARDPLHQQIVTSFKIAYFQTEVRLEDYFMDRGFKFEAAQSLAYATLQSLVGYHLERFV